MPDIDTAQDQPEVFTSVTPTPKPDRKSIRDAIFSSKKPMSKVISFFGQQIELRQPTLEDILSVQSAEDRKAAVIDTLVKYAYVPGTDEHIFEDTDGASIMGLPFGQDMISVTAALEELTSVNFQDGKSTSSSTPLA